jgi:hypothetical protein
LTSDSKDTEALQMALQAFPAGSYELLGNGLPLRRYVKDANEKGELLHMHWWEVAVPMPPRSVRLVMFAHTILASQENDPRIKAELSFIDNSVRNATFARVPGVAGPFNHE